MTIVNRESEYFSASETGKEFSPFPRVPEMRVNLLTRKVVPCLFTELIEQNFDQKGLPMSVIVRRECSINLSITGRIGPHIPCRDRPFFEPIRLTHVSS